MALSIVARFSHSIHPDTTHLKQFRPVTSIVKGYFGLLLNRKFSTEAAGESTPKESDKEIESLKTEMQKITERYNDLDDKYKRALAESENMRKRLMKQIDEAKLFGIQSFCKDLLEVADILTSATKSAPQDQLKDGVNPPFANLYHGLVLTENQLFKVRALCDHILCFEISP
ncbi:unnamed protein product [Schistosoma spindalis]|nr:unnamed protein product [Schistosoma spindale]